jgi:hypothetical protein
MIAPRLVLPMLLAAAGLGLWLLLAGVESLSGLDTGPVGFAVLVLSAWSALYGVWRLSLTEAELQVSPAEWKAWIGTAFMAVAVLYFIGRVHVFQTPSLADSPEARLVGRNLGLLFVSWTVLSSTIGRRWKGRVQEDERDREIERVAAGWARSAVSAMIVFLAVLLGLSPADRLQWATLPMIATLLVLVLMLGSLVENGTSAVRHWLDRR